MRSARDRDGACEWELDMVDARGRLAPQAGEPCIYYTRMHCMVISDRLCGYFCSERETPEISRGGGLVVVIA